MEVESDSYFNSAESLVPDSAEMEHFKQGKGGRGGKTGLAFRLSFQMRIFFGKV